MNSFKIWRMDNDIKTDFTKPKMVALFFLFKILKIYPRFLEERIA